MNPTHQAPSKKLLAVFAHPDDESFICGGTLAKYAGREVDITLVSATRGEMGRRMGNPPYLNRESMAAARETELRNACDCLGIRQLLFLDIRDKTVEFADENSLTARIAALIDEIDPDVVLTFHEKLGGHPDHCAIGKATTAAFQRTGQRGALYYITFGDAMERPERFGYSRQDVVKIDVHAHLDAKLAAFRAHRCQTEIDEWVWLPDQEAKARFGKYEYFLKADVASSSLLRDDLFMR
ncbi:PIG-L family deacetylase [Paenibacillus sp. GCM10023248]|uniref:PIG-L family deacetylase n=1 Tax=Bacillales TaxID=1385 RepID=UPI0023795A03|nr:MULTISPECIES: PIG-L family deacetylase [Bacillales]MDD9269449.1 PIG-L family deacetylase [Paenibacillus sp. MAHUQ-63]MDR6880935.1 bacillithiol biosynthesis deacetylase BshB2 [Bacillus sp. 3255]